MSEIVFINVSRSEVEVLKEAMLERGMEPHPDQDLIDTHPGYDEIGRTLNAIIIRAEMKLP